MKSRISFKHVLRRGLKKSLWRLSTDCGAISRAFNLRTSPVEVFNTIPITHLYGHKATGEALLKGHFTFSRQHIDVGAQGDPWTLTTPSEQFAFWLHSFDWLDDLVALQTPTSTVRARLLVDRWIKTYGKWNAYAWDNDILANRLYAWLSVWTGVLSTDSLSPAGEERRICVVRQLKRLKQTYSRTPAGLAKMRAAVALALGGLYIKSKTSHSLNRALDWLVDELELQILPDGGHISRSPLQTLKALIMLSKLQDSMVSLKFTPPKELSRAIERLRHVIPFFQMSDGGLPLFHGSHEGDTALIRKYVKKSDKSSKPFSYCPHSGYQRLERNGIIILVDTGDSPPLSFDREAHLSPLAFEMSSEAGRLIVSCGWHHAHPLKWRSLTRTTAAHSTLILNDMNAGDILNHGFGSRVLGGAISTPVSGTIVARKEEPTGIWLDAVHKAYMSRTGLSHRRRIYMSQNGYDIRGEDSLFVPVDEVPLSRESINFDIRFHLHPNVRATLAQDLQSALLIQSGQVGWRFRTDGGPMKIENSVYLGHGSRPLKTQQIVISGQAYCDGDGENQSNRVRWSLRRLDGKNKK